MRNVKKEVVDVSGKRNTVKAPRAASFGALAFCLAVMGFVVKKGMDLDKKEAEAKAAEENKTEE